MKTRNSCCLSILIVLGLLMSPQVAASESASKKEVVGFGSGALIGASAGGPVGAIIGAAIGAFLGDAHNELDDTQEQLHQGQLAAEEADSHHRELSFAKLSVEQKLSVALHEIEELSGQVNDLTSRQALLDGVQYDVFFATDEADFDDAELQRLGRLAALVRATPNALVQVSGYADVRGSAEYNETLSLDRAYAVADALSALGVHQKQLQTFAYGDSAAQSKEAETFALDRRVNITVKMPTVNLSAHESQDTWINEHEMKVNIEQTSADTLPDEQVYAESIVDME